MKKNMKHIIIIAALLLTTMTSWAVGTIRIVSATNGTITSAVDGTTVTLTAKPDAGYYITAKYITVEKTIDGSMIGIRRHAPSISEQLEVNATDTQADSTKVTTYTFTLPEGYDAEVTAEFQVYTTTEVNYNIYINNTLITESNKDDVLGDANIANKKAPSVFYNDTTKTLILTKAENVDIQCFRKDILRIFILGNCTGEVIHSANSFCKLLFTTDGVYPGELVLDNPSGPVVEGFGEIELDDFIEAENLNTNKGSVKVLLKTITDPRHEKTPIDDLLQAENEQAGQQEPGKNTFINIIKNDILYTYDTDSQSGPDPSDNSFLINKTSSFQEISDALELLEFSFLEYAKKICGISCVLPPGEILLKVDAVTMGDMQLYLGIKGLDPIRIMPDSVYNILLTEPTPIALFAHDPAEISEGANHRIGRKTPGSVGVYSVSLTPTKVNSSNSVSIYSSSYPTSTLEHAAQDPSNDTPVTDHNTVEVIDQKTAEGKITGITPPHVITIDLRNKEVPVYDLQGRRVRYPYRPGIYITQGKKVVIK